MAISQEPLGSEGQRLDPEAALRFPVGVASPLWFAFGAAAATASTWWWMARWTRDLALECAGGVVAAGGVPAVPVESATFAPEDEEPLDEADAAAKSAAEAVADAAGLVVDPMIEQPVAVAPEPAPIPAVQNAAKAAADDLTRLVGVGPRLAAQLAEQGVTTFTQIAAWNADQLGEIDKTLNLRGRAVRDAWVSQAKRLAAQP